MTAVQEKLIEPHVFAQPAHHSTTALPKLKARRSSMVSPWRRLSVSKAGDRLLAPTSLEPILPMSPIRSPLDKRPQTPDSQASDEQITALPQSRVLKTSPHLRPAKRDHADIPYDFRLPSSHSRPDSAADAHTTYRSFRKLSLSGSRFGRSTRANSQSQHVREEELRAMSSSATPSRAPTRGGDTGILRRESRKMRSGLNMKLERPESNISLPRADNSLGSMMRQPDARSYRISIMDIMSPRPIIKSTEPYSMITLGVTDSRLPSRRQMTATGTESGRKSKRILDLADNLDSHGLRAAMERDQRRREKKKETDAAKLRRKLERRAEKQRAEDSAEEKFSNPFDDILHAATVAARTPSKSRAQQHNRRRSSSASRVEHKRPAHDFRASTPPPIPSKSEARAATSDSERLKWPRRTDSRKPAPALVSKRRHLLRHEDSFDDTYNAHNITEENAIEKLPSSHGPQASVDGETTMADRIVPEQDPDDAEPPAVARRRHPAHEIPHVAHLYSRTTLASPIMDSDDPLTSPGSRIPTSTSRAIEQLDADSLHTREPVLDFRNIEIPDTFAPVEDTETRQIRPVTSETNGATRLSPLLLMDGEEIPGLPFLSSEGSEDNSPLVSPFAASFPTKFPDVDFAAPAPVVHRDPLPTRKARQSSLSPGFEDGYLSTSSITALPQIPFSSKAEQEPEKRRRKRGPSLLLSFFRRGDKGGSRPRSISDTAPATPVLSGFEHDFPGQKFVGIQKPGNSATGAAFSQESRLGSPVGPRSRFKENLSALNIHVSNQVRPLSPPQSGVNSPYNQITPSSPEYIRGALITPISHPRYSEQSTFNVAPESHRRSNSLTRASNPVNQSLASIDSEGSWLTGKPARGLSTRSTQLRNMGSIARTSSGKVQQHRRNQSNASSVPADNHEPLMAVDHFGLRPSKSVNRGNAAQSSYSRLHNNEQPLDTEHMASSEIIVRSIIHDGPEDVHGSARLSTELVARQPSVNRGHRVKSSEGLFKDFKPSSTANTDIKEGLHLHEDSSLYDETSAEATPSEKAQIEILRALSVKAPQRVHRRDDSGPKIVEVQSKRNSPNYNKDISQLASQ